MKRLRLPLLALMTISFVLPPTVGTAEEPRTPKALVLPLTGVGTGGVTFKRHRGRAALRPAGR
jgi:hypothetical protein